MVLIFTKFLGVQREILPSNYDDDFINQQIKDLKEKERMEREHENMSKEDCISSYYNKYKKYKKKYMLLKNKLNPH